MVCLNVSIIKPLVKDSNKSTDDINNLRGIAVSDVISNLYESVLDGIVRSYAVTDDKQFGFKANNSCAHAILVLKQILNLAKHFKMRLYISAIDAAKAFDKVNRDILWNRLIEMQVPLIYVIAIKEYYSKSVMMMELEGDFSKMFKTTLGVRQGGVLSPLFFCIYIDNLLKSLQEMELGVKIGKMCIDVLAYADDILIITHTRINMQLMLNRLSELGEELEIKFNPKNERREDSWNGILLLAGKKIEEVNTFKYLGAEIDNNNNNKHHIKKRKSAVIGAVVKLIASGISSENMHPIPQAEMFKTHVRPILFYSLESMHLSLNDMIQIKRIEVNALKRLLGLNTSCKSTDLFLSFEMLNTYDRIKWLKLNHYMRMTKNNFTNSLLKELENKFIKNSFIEEIKEITASVILPSECTLYDKCIVSIEDLNDKHVNQVE